MHEKPAVWLLLSMLVCGCTGTESDGQANGAGGTPEPTTTRISGGGTSSVSSSGGLGGTASSLLGSSTFAAGTTMGGVLGTGGSSGAVQSSTSLGGSSTGGVVQAGMSGKNTGGANTGGKSSGGLGGANTGGKSSGGLGGANTGGKSSGGLGGTTNSGGSSTVATGGCLGGPGIVVPTGYTLQWSDEFNADGRPNPANWSFETGFVRNEEAQWYQEDNARVEKGCLIIEGKRERKANPNYKAGSTDWKTSRQYAEYTSSSLRTMGKQTWQYGRFEMRGRIKIQAGLWPAWWTLGAEKEWPSCGEIDIMEYYAGFIRANVACGTATRWQAKWDSVGWNTTTFEDKNWENEFHIWRMDWDATTISLYLDDLLINGANLSDMLNADGSSPFKQTHYMLLNLAIGGQNGGDPSKTAFPSLFEVDYVRVFKK